MGKPAATDRPRLTPLRHSFTLDGEAYLSSVHPGIELEEVLSNTGWKLRIGEHLSQTSEPSAAELKAISDYDQEGFWTK